MQPIGINFAPLPGQEPQGAGGGDQASGAPAQDAIRTLNLSVPRVTGSAPINQSLLGGQGSAGLPSMAGLGGLDQFLRMLFGVMQQGGGQPQPPIINGTGAPPANMFLPFSGGSAPSALGVRVTPGLETGGGPSQTGAPRATTTTGQSLDLFPKMPTPAGSAPLPAPSQPTGWDTPKPAPMEWNSFDWA